MRSIIVFFLIFIVSSPVEVLARISEESFQKIDLSKVETPRINVPFVPDDTPDFFNDLNVPTERNIPNSFAFNPLHVLCIPCNLVSGLIGGVVGGFLRTVLGERLTKQLGIFGCSYLVSFPLQARFLPNLICTAVFEVMDIITKKANSETTVCSLLMMCPKKKVLKTLFKVQNEDVSPADQHENAIIEILQSEQLVPLTEEMEDFNNYLAENVISTQVLNGTAYEPQIRHLIRNFVGAVQYQIGSTR